MAQIKQLAQDPEYHPIILRVCQQLADFTPFLTEATQDQAILQYQRAHEKSPARSYKSITNAAPKTEMYRREYSKVSSQYSPCHPLI